MKALMKAVSVPRRFRNDGLESVDLTDTQMRARDVIRDKMASGEYKIVDVPCPLCGEDDDVVVAEKDFYGFASSTVVCRSCGMVYTNPRLTVGALQKMYANEYRDLDRSKPSSSDYFMLEKTKSIRMMEFLETHDLMSRLHGKLIVEIGCGAGGGLQHFADVGFRVVGCDLSPVNVDYACSNGIEAYYGSLDIVVEKLGDRASEVGLVIYEQVFEHLADPRGELQKLARWLPRDALLYIGVPGFKNIGKAYGSDLMPFLQIPHLCHFELRTLTAMLRREGFVDLVGDESARALFRYSGEVFPVEISPGQYEIVRSYLRGLERRRALLTPMRVLRVVPLKLGLKLRKVINESEFLPASLKRWTSTALRATYHLFVK